MANIFQASFGGRKKGVVDPRSPKAKRQQRGGRIRKALASRTGPIATAVRGALGRAQPASRLGRKSLGRGRARPTGARRTRAARATAVRPPTLTGGGGFKGGGGV